MNDQAIINASTLATPAVLVLFFVAALACTQIGSSVAAQELAVASVSPTPGALAASRYSAIAVTFDKPVMRESVTPLGSFWAFARWSGTVTGTFEFSNDDKTISLIPDRMLSAGESVMVILSHSIRAADGNNHRAAGYSWQFWVRSHPANMAFQQVASMSTNIASESSRPYGGIASDLDRDGWLDLTIVNEDTADLRTFMNKADGSGEFNPMQQPTDPLGNRASPSEPSDFNRDGFVDISVVNIEDNTVSILLGNGDGTFAAQQLVDVGNAPRGIAVLDSDGDGDIDIVNTNSDSGNLSLLRNDGNGIFSAPVFFDAGTGGEWALAAGDMNGDGIVDLVTGAHDTQEIYILTGNGDGSFSLSESEDAGGEVWMLVLGDVNKDGFEDVATANGMSNSGSILLGDGNGQLATTVTQATDSFTISSDLGDIDGDGDLDWVTSSFQGDWSLFLNQGKGNFILDREFTAPVASSCALLADFDNDFDLDLALVDEQADLVITMSNGGPDIPTFQINPGLSGAWYNPANPGQGFFLEVMPKIPLIFLGWFTYDTSQPTDAPMASVGHTGHRWLTAQGSYTDATSEMSITLTTGGLFLRSDPVSRINDGTMTLKFHDCGNATVDYQLTVSGLSGSFPISRLTSDNVALCNAMNEELQAGF